METAKTSFRIYQKTLDKVTAKERKILNCLTLNGASSMREDVLSRRVNLDKYKIFLAKSEGKILGWSALFPENLVDPFYKDSKAYCCYTYVRYSHRKQGIGTRLLKRAAKAGSELGVDVKVFPWDDRSDAFFEKKRAKVVVVYE